MTNSLHTTGYIPHTSHLPTSILMIFFSSKDQKPFCEREQFRMETLGGLNSPPRRLPLLCFAPNCFPSHVFPTPACFSKHITGTPARGEKWQRSKEVIRGEKVQNLPLLHAPKPPSNPLSLMKGCCCSFLAHEKKRWSNI